MNKENTKQNTQFEGQTNFVYSIAVSADNQLIVSGSSDSTVRVWQLSSGKLKWKLEGDKSAVDAVIERINLENFLAGIVIAFGMVFAIFLVFSGIIFDFIGLALAICFIIDVIIVGVWLNG